MMRFEANFLCKSVQNDVGARIIGLEPKPIFFEILKNASTKLSPTYIYASNICTFLRNNFLATKVDTWFDDNFDPIRS